jgi:hypothetical protein
MMALSIKIFLFIGAMAFGLGMIQFLSSHKKLVYSLLTAGGATFLTLAAVELTFSRLDNHMTDRKFLYSKPFTTEDPILGYKPVPNNHVTVTKILGTSQVYRATYTIDQFGRRCLPLDNNTMANSGYICLFGCSFTFGEGVEDDETLSYFLAKQTSTRIYNYGFCGYGPQQMLSLLKSGKLTNEIPARDGIFLYVYLCDDHERRVIGGMHVYNGWGQNMPYYTLGSSNELINAGNFESGRPLLSKLYSLLGRSSMLKYFGFNYPIVIRDEHIELTARIIKESKELIYSSFVPKEFYVVIYPHPKQDDRMRRLLNSWGIKCLDYSFLFDRQDSRFTIHPLDDHPNKSAYRLLAKGICDDVQVTGAKEMVKSQPARGYF